MVTNFFLSMVRTRYGDGNVDDDDSNDDDDTLSSGVASMREDSLRRVGVVKSRLPCTSFSWLPVARINHRYGGK